MSQNTSQTSTSEVLVICPKHGEHEYAIIGNIPGHEGVWCQLCWQESMGPSLPYKTLEIKPEDVKAAQAQVQAQFEAEYKKMEQTTELPDVTWKRLKRDGQEEG